MAGVVLGEDILLEVRLLPLREVRDIALALVSAQDEEPLAIGREHAHLELLRIGPVLRIDT